MAVGVGAVVRFAAAPGALPGETVPLIQNLRLGTTYSLDAGGGAVPTALWPPFGVGLAAYLPLSAKLVSLVVSLLVIAMARSPPGDCRASEPLWWRPGWWRWCPPAGRCR
ncbi:MAG: hypothetical protein R2699_06570 [Acidimicrobiales bacterium]